jgi:hypothetical protein
MRENTSRMESGSMNLASQDCHLVAQHDDLDRDICVAATGKLGQLEHAAERPKEE